MSSQKRTRVLVRQPHCVIGSWTTHSRSASFDFLCSTMTASQGQNSSSSPPPTITYHPSPTLLPIPPPQIAQAAVGGAHYSTMYTSHRRRGSSIDEPHRTPQSAGDVEASGRRKIVDDLNELFCCRPNIDIFKRTWRRDAVFEDPWVKCEGYDEYAPQFFAMPKLLSRADILSSRIMLSIQSPNRLIYSKSQEYTLRFLGKKKRVDSIVVVDLDEHDKIIRVEDKWGVRSCRHAMYRSGNRTRHSE
ncbi:hypothetical protein EDC04DRAFT_1815242 [Pisolithus marmoratus]|nr:hypothetical protein EDC04DRAFT_1815242 [Pisolithus marmoratus]